LHSAHAFYCQGRRVPSAPMRPLAHLLRLGRLLPASRRLHRAARDHFGWRSLRPAQLTAMRSVLAGNDTLVVLPTGAGKSAVYQLPAALLSGPTLVISPLLALQHDQLTNLNARGSDDLLAVRISSAET